VRGGGKRLPEGEGGMEDGFEVLHYYRPHLTGESVLEVSTCSSSSSGIEEEGEVVAVQADGSIG